MCILRDLLTPLQEKFSNSFPILCEDKEEKSGLHTRYWQWWLIYIINYLSFFTCFAGFVWTRYTESAVLHLYSQQYTTIKRLVPNHVGMSPHQPQKKVSLLPWIFSVNRR